MRIAKLSAVCLVWASVMLIAGCISEQQYKQLQVQNATQNKLITELRGQLQTKAMELEKCQSQLDTASEASGVDKEALQETITALEGDLEKKKALIESMRLQLLGGVALPPELSTMLQDFAESQEMVTFDESRGIVKFKSDLLFATGSDEVVLSAQEAVKSLCGILNSEEGKKFDIIIAGHTDDIPIGKPETRAKHPTNWHLSAHRAISVLNIMARYQVAEGRMSARGFGEFRPIVPNAPGKKGNPQNRRVEIYIVTKGM
jgi:chemotaxis protein MotB